MQLNYRIVLSVLIALILIAVLALLLLPQPSEEPEPLVIETPRPLPTPKAVTVEKPQETEPPAITPPAESAASGSDIILQPVKPATDPDLVPVGTAAAPDTPTA